MGDDRKKGEPTRRELLRRVGGAALVLGGGSSAAWLTLDDGAERAVGVTSPSQPLDRRTAPAVDLPELVIARGGGVEDIVRAAMDRLGGMGRFIEPGDRVLVKPNMGWDRIPLMAANTNPAVVATVVRLCREAGAELVTVGDVSCNDPRRAYDRSGIAAAAREAGAELVLPDERLFRELDLGGVALRSWPVFEPALTCTKLINVPVVKTHTLTGLTCALKNWYGLIGGRRERLHQRIHDSVADLAAFFLPTLTIVDAVRVMWRGGPTGGDVSDTRRLDTVVASTDQVAADVVACGLVDLRQVDVPYIGLAARRGVGRVDLDLLRRAEVDLG